MIYSINMIIIIGLGNPGEKYSQTRHNVGFMAIDEFASKNSFPEFELNKKSNALISDNNEILLAKPQTFMNESGITARELIKKYKSKEPKLVVVHDDIDLPVGKIKIVEERGSAGHKGVESIIEAVGNKGLVRLRVGIGSAENIKAKEIVLEKFSEAEKTQITETIKKTAEALNLYINEGIEKAMAQFN